MIVLIVLTVLPRRIPLTYAVFGRTVPREGIVLRPSYYRPIVLARTVPIVLRTVPRTVHAYLSSWGFSAYPWGERPIATVEDGQDGRIPSAYRKKFS